MINVEVIADSMSHAGKRITTFVCEYPRFIHSELMTHRVFARCAASSRAIPVAKMLARVHENPATPEWWGANQKGMQAEEELTGDARDRVEREWWYARDNAAASASALIDLGLHKQLANRLLEPWLNIITVITATEWTNFYALRTDKHAQPEFRVLAEKMLAAHNASEPALLNYGQWHLPFIREAERAAWGLDDVRVREDIKETAQVCENAIKASVSRCARVSTLNHDGTEPDLVADLALHDRLLAAHHVSPFEHQATPLIGPASVAYSGNLRGWHQYRKTLPNENIEQFEDLVDKSYIATRHGKR